jgi:hypothetical protein
MADEVLECTTNKKRDYNMKAYETMRSVLLQKALKMSENWNSEMLGRALWAEAIVRISTPQEESSQATLDCQKSVSVNAKRKKHNQIDNEVENEENGKSTRIRKK